MTVTCLLMVSPCIFADSPLTSTEFNRPYSDDRIVILAGKGLLTPEIADYLASEENPVDVKMAVINRLGWDFHGKNNAVLFRAHIIKSSGYKNTKDLLKKGKDYELLCLAYLMAMDNYFVVDDAIDLAEKAVAKNPGSYTFNIICALIKAQKEQGLFEWCEVYNLTNRVREDKSLRQDIKPEAAEIIFSYMDQYQEYCIPIND